MKKTLLFVALFAAVAMASSGGNILLAHAQTAMTDTATLQQQLDDAKAQLIQLEMQAGQVPAGDTGTPTGAMTATVSPMVTVTPVATLSPSDISQMNAALTALATLLTTLQTKVAQDPQFITSNGPVVVSALQNIGQTIAVIGTEMNGSPVAMTVTAGAMPSQAMPAMPAMPATTGGGGGSATGNTVSAAVTQPSQAVAQVTPTVAPTTPPVGTPANTAPVTPAPQTAQATSAFSFSQLNWPLIIVIVLIVAAIAIWLWWDDEDEKKKPVVKISSPAPQKPMQQAQPVQTATQPSMNSVTVNNFGANNGANANRQPTSVQTPLSAAVAPHANR